VNGGTATSRPQDAIASILASMNTMTQSETSPHQATTMRVSAPLDYSTSVVQGQDEEEEEVGRSVQLEQHQFDPSSRTEILPLNLATSQHASVIQVMNMQNSGDKSQIIKFR